MKLTEPEHEAAVGSPGIKKQKEDKDDPREVESEPTKFTVKEFFNVARDHSLDDLLREFSK